MAAWTPERIERPKELWSEGLSANAVARQLGNATRSSVIGKIHRLGLPPRGQDTKWKNHANKGIARPRAMMFPGNCGSVPKLRTAPIKIAPDLEAPKPIVDALGNPITVLNAKDGHCRYPHGELGNGTFRFCGHKAERGSWCVFHRTRVYTPPMPRKNEAVT